MGVGQHIIVLGILVVIYHSVLGKEEAVKPPNIIIILADDLGHNDVSFHGSQEIPTPNLDALAYDGIILDRFYVQRICTPSRAALMTGRHPTQLGLQVGVIMSAERYGLGLNETLLPQYLKKLGYTTHAIGKWHLGMYAKEFTPTYRGFDTFFGFLQGRQDYYDHTFKLNDAWGLDLRNNTDLVRTEFGHYSTEMLTQEAVRRINNHDTDKPMFMYFPQQGVHAGNEQTDNPLEAPWKYVRKFQHIQHKQRQIYAGMVSAVDDSVGHLVSALHSKGMLNNTVILFSTDNGGPAAGYDRNQACNWPLRGMKYTLWEGGIRGAAFIWSPLLRNSGYISSQPMQIEDMFPTLLHAAGYDTSTLPGYLYGRDMWRTLSENTNTSREEMFHNANSAAKAVRVGDMKLIISSKDSNTAKHGGWYQAPQIDGAVSEYNTELNSDYFSLNDHNIHQNVTFRDHEQIPVNYTLFHSDIPRFLADIGRKYRPPKPVLVHCGSWTHNQSKCNIAKHPCLFNVTADPCEYHNLATVHPELVSKMKTRLEFYERQAAPPRNKPNDPKGYPKYHGGIWEPWVNLDDEALTAMRQGLLV